MRTTGAMLTLNHLRFGFVALAAALAGTLAWRNVAETGASFAPQAVSAARQPVSPQAIPPQAPPRPIAPAAVKPADAFTAPANPASVPQEAPAIGNTSAAPGADRLSERKSLEARLTQAQDYAPFIRKYNSAFPADWAAFTDRAAREHPASAAADNTDSLMAEAVRDLRRARGITASRASPAALLRVLSSQSAILSALSVIDKRMCVDFLFGQQNDAFLAFSNRNRPLIAAMANSALDAIIEGAAGKPPRAPPTDLDFDVLEKALRDNGLDNLEIEAMLDGRLPDPPLSDDRLCKAGNIYLETLKTLPEGPRLRLNALAVELTAKL